jgi:hypothetical protein
VILFRTAEGEHVVSVEHIEADGQSDPGSADEAGDDAGDDAGAPAED